MTRLVIEDGAGTCEELAETFAALRREVDSDDPTRYTNEALLEETRQLRDSLTRQIAAAEHIRDSGVHRRPRWRLSVGRPTL